MNAWLVVRMTAPLIATSALLLALSVGAAWYVHHLQKTVAASLLAETSAVRAAEELEILVRETRTRMDYFLITGDRKYLEEIRRLRLETEPWFTRAEQWSQSSKEMALTSRAHDAYGRFVSDLHRFETKASPDSQAPAIRGWIDGFVGEVQEPVHEFLDLNEQEVETAIADNEAFANRLVIGLLLLGICGSGAGLTTGFGVARAFQRRLVQLSVPIRDAAGRLDQVVGPITFAASTDLRELESVLHRIADRIGAVIDRLRHSERQALRAEQLASVGQMAAGMAHELRNPLTSMRLLVQSAQTRERTSSTVGPCLEGRDLVVVEEEITRLEQLVHSFLQFALPPRIEKRTVDLRPLVDGALDLARVRATATDVAIEFIRPAEPVVANVDPAQFRQLLLNLTLNGLDAVASGGRIWVRLSGDVGGSVTLTIADTGHGIADALGTSIFTPFVTTKDAGLGLGLSICKRIAEAHGGEISARNRAEGGAEFTLRLPPEDDKVTR